MTSVNGIKASHAFITDTCRATRGDDNAIDEALARLKKSAQQCLKGFPIGKGAQFHFVLTVEKPAK